MSELIEKINAISGARKVLVIAVICLGSVYLGYVDEVSPAQEELEAAEVAAAALDKEISELQEINKSLASINEELRRAEDEMASLKSILPEETQVENLLSSISGSAKATGVIIVSFQPTNLPTQAAPQSTQSPRIESQSNAEDKLLQDKQTNSLSSKSLANVEAKDESGGLKHPAELVRKDDQVAYQTYLDLNLSGTYAQLVSFFDRVLQIDRILHLNSFSINLKAGQESNFSGTRQLTAQAQFVAFSQKAQELTLPSEAKDDPYGIKARKAKEQQKNDFLSLNTSTNIEKSTGELSEVRANVRE